MTEYSFEGLGRIDHEIRLNELKEQARELAGGEVFIFEDEDAPEEAMEGFWQNIVDVERGGWTSARRQLENDGLTLPAPDELDERQMMAKLWEVIHQLAKHHTFFHHTDHFSDRQLYKELWQETLDEEFPEMLDLSPNGMYIIDMLGSGSEQDTYLHLKYYASAQEREEWLKEFPDYQMPQRQRPPYNRDWLLPEPPQAW